MTGAEGGGAAPPRPAPGARGTARLLLRCLCDGARLMVGVPRYEDYVEHMERNHPTRPVMTYAEFVRDRQAARFGEGGGGGLRCC